MRFIAVAVFWLLAASAMTGSPPAATQHDGLTATLQASPATLSMGDAVKFHVTLAFDTTIAASDTRMLNQFSGRCEFQFLNKKTGKSYGRAPYSTGMPAMERPGNLAHLKHRDRLALEDLTVHLLSERGEQIPAGEYSVTAIYENDGGGKIEAYLDSTSQYRRRVYDGRWTLWTGKIESQPCAVTILPASEGMVEVAVPKTLVVDSTRAPGQIGWTYKETSQVRVNKRPGFALGNRWHLETRVDGATISEYPRGDGLDPSGMSFLPPDVSAQVHAGKDAELILHMEVFETSVQPQHMWMPEQGDFKILWRGQTRYKFSGSGK
jgi:hypothetical protein